MFMLFECGTFFSAGGRSLCGAQHRERDRLIIGKGVPPEKKETPSLKAETVS
jgi:hypothetical protein